MEYCTDRSTQTRDQTGIAYHCAYQESTEKKLLKDVMTMLDTLEWIELLTCSETDSTGLIC